VLTGFRVEPGRLVGARRPPGSCPTAQAGCPDPLRLRQGHRGRVASPRSAAVQNVMDYLAPSVRSTRPEPSATIRWRSPPVSLHTAVWRMLRCTPAWTQSPTALRRRIFCAQRRGRRALRCSVPATCSRSRSHPMRAAQLRRCALAASFFRYAPFFHAMLDAGCPLPVFEAWFVSAAHDDAAVSRILEALPAAARAAAEAVPAINCPRSPACVPRSTVCSACGLPPAV
jgi:hypothetical protein